MARGEEVLAGVERQALLAEARRRRAQRDAGARTLRRLSDPRRQVLRFLADRQSVGCIAVARFVSEATVRSQVRAILDQARRQLAARGRGHRPPERLAAALEPRVECCTRLAIRARWSEPCTTAVLVDTQRSDCSSARGRWPSARTRRHPDLGHPVGARPGRLPAGVRASRAAIVHPVGQASGGGRMVEGGVEVADDQSWTSEHLALAHDRSWSRRHPSMSMAGCTACTATTSKGSGAATFTTWPELRIGRALARSGKRETTTTPAAPGSAWPATCGSAPPRPMAPASADRGECFRRHLGQHHQVGVRRRRSAAVPARSARPLAGRARARSGPACPTRAHRRTPGPTDHTCRPMPMRHRWPAPSRTLRSRPDGWRHTSRHEQDQATR